MSFRILTVSEFLTGVNEALSGVPALVEGEVSGLSSRQQKWVFFSLKDDQGVVECFLPAWKLHHQIEDGMLVRVAGVPRIYERSGRFRIVVEQLQPAGEGSLRRAFELLQNKLDGEGLFATARKRSLPRFPERVAVIASSESAAWGDFRRILENRWGGVEVVLLDVRVQGPGAVSDIVEAFLTLENIQPVDGVILTRGGGSLEDLQAFNSEDVARAVFSSTAPVVVGVGHERDVTIADLVCDVRASTPSNAAELVVPDRRAVGATILASTDMLGHAIRATIQAHETVLRRFVSAGRRLTQSQLMTCERVHDRLASSMSEMIRGAEARRILYGDRCRKGAHALVQQRGTRLASLQRLLENLNPERMLARGFSISTVGGSVVRDAAALTHGDELTTRFHSGSATSTVTTVQKS
jgi:exodeoxyribonuclease VII large subunit